MAQVNWDEPEPPELAKPEPTFSDVFLVIYGYIIYLYNVISTIFFFGLIILKKPFPDAHTLLFPVFQDDLLRYLKDIFCKQQVEFIQFPFADMAIGGTL